MNHHLCNEHNLANPSHQIRGVIGISNWTSMSTLLSVTQIGQDVKAHMCPLLVYASSLVAHSFHGWGRSSPQWPPPIVRLIGQPVECVWLKRLFVDLGMRHPSAAFNFTDSERALAVVKNPVFHGRTKHIEVQWLSTGKAGSVYVEALWYHLLAQEWRQKQRCKKQGGWTHTRREKKRNRCSDSD